MKGRGVRGGEPSLEAKFNVFMYSLRGKRMSVGSVKNITHDSKDAQVDSHAKMAAKLQAGHSIFREQTSTHTQEDPRPTGNFGSDGSAGEPCASKTEQASTR